LRFNGIFNGIYSNGIYSNGIYSNGIYSNGNIMGYVMGYNGYIMGYIMGYIYIFNGKKTIMETCTPRSWEYVP
jgi:hypothetical protein